MFLNTEQANIPMKLIFQLAIELKRDPMRVAKVRALSADISRPNMGLKEGFGLFNSDEWWENIKNGNIKNKYVSGVIEYLSHAGQDQGDDVNSFALILDDGSTKRYGICCNDPCDAELFCLGTRVDVFCIFAPLKNSRPPGVGLDFSEMVIEMAVSTTPVASILDSQRAGD